jgi:hypothetical protein
MTGNNWVKGSMRFFSIISNKTGKILIKSKPEWLKLMFPLSPQKPTQNELEACKSYGLDAF